MQELQRFIVALEAQQQETLEFIETHGHHNHMVKGAKSLEVGRYVMSGLGLPPKGSYHGAFAHPPRALLHVHPQGGSPNRQKGSVAVSSTLHRVLPKEVTNVRPKSHIPLLRADDTWGRVPSHVLVNVRILGSRG